MLNQIRIVLVETSLSANIGSAARAMKTMGLSQLYLVSPKQGIDEHAVALSAGAENVLQNAMTVSSFDEAVADCSLVIGTSARLRHLQNTLIEPRECGEKTVQYASQYPQEKVAIVFGRERIGLTNEELQKCRYHLTIPANPDYSSLNLAMAVQIVSYELRCAWLGLQDKQVEISPQETLATNQSLEYFFQQTEQLYSELGFIQNQAVMAKLRRLYQRAGIEQNELNILQGMIASVKRALAKS